MISVASTERFSRVSATCTSASGASGRAGRDPECRPRARRSPRISSSRRRTSPGVGGSSSGGQRQVALAAEQLAVRAEHLVVDVVGIVGAQDLARRLRQVELARRPCSAPSTSCASACTLYSSARSKGLLAMPCATSQVSADAHRHSSSSGVSIQSRISPNSERCSRWKSFTRLRARRLRGSSRGSSRGRARWRCGSGPSRSSCAGGGCRPRSRCC